MSLPGALSPNVGRKVEYVWTDCPTSPYVSTVVYECRTGQLVVDFIVETDTGGSALLIIEPPSPDCYHQTKYVS